LVKKENSGLLPDSHSILITWSKFFILLLNVHGVNDVKQAEMHTAEPLVPEPSPYEAKIATEKSRRYKQLNGGDSFLRS
jgi:hypothetical protein